MHRFFPLLSGLVVFVFGLSVVSAEVPPLADVIGAARQAAVEVLVDGQLKGGGAFVSADGLVITAAHVFSRPGARFAVITAADERLATELVAYDKGHDLALLRVAAGNGATRAFLEVRGEIPPVGSRVFNLGNALRVRATVMDGMVSRADPVFSELAESNGYIENYLVAGMTPSLTSGGVWIDRRGRIVGLQSGRLNDGKIASGLAIVAPPQAITKLVTTRKTASTPDIGAWIWEAWTADKDYLASIPEGTEGLVITWLRKGGPLEKADLKRLDTILAFNGKPVRRRGDLMRLVRSRSAGETVTLTILKQHEETPKKVEVTLESQEEFWRQANGNKPEMKPESAGTHH